jgi:hypothetical protein
MAITSAIMPGLVAPVRPPSTTPTGSSATGNLFGLLLVLAMLSLAYAGAAALASLRSRTEEQAVSPAVVLGGLALRAYARTVYSPG